jgi:myo-inositol 2-dehydrogenase/D-chiro-inositol 1-dehydrogenase
MTTPLRIGIVGAGRIGAVHAANLSTGVAGARLVSIADITLSAAEALAARLGIAQAYADPRRIIEDRDVDAVLICSSTDTHALLIEACAQAGKHIFCEKPIALDLQQIDRALGIVAETGVKLQVGFNRRFDPSFAALRQAVMAGQVGKVETVRITSRDPQPPPIGYIRVSGGIFLDMTIHDFEMARFLVGDEVVEVQAAGAVLVDEAIGEAGDVDTAVVTLRFAGGALGVIENSRRAAYGYDQRAEVFGSLGMVASSNHTAHSAVLSDAHGVHGPLPLFFFLERYTQAYINEIQAFVDSIRNDTPPPVSGADARVPVVMGLAAWRSVRERRSVRLAEIDA